MMKTEDFMFFIMNSHPQLLLIHSMMKLQMTEMTDQFVILQIGTMSI